MANIYSVLSNETLDKIAAGGDLYESMTDEELDKVIQIEKEETQASSYNNQGSSDDYSQLWESYKGAFPEPNWGDSIEQDNSPNEVIGKTAPLLTKEDAKAMPSMGASEIAALQAQQQGGPTAYEADGSISNWLGNLWNAISFNSSGKLTAKSTARHNQSILRGTVKKDGKEVPLTELDDDELDYLVDSAGWNGWTGWLGSFVGNRSDDGIMQYWDRTTGATIKDPVARKAARVKYAQDIARGMIEQRESEKAAATIELENRPKQFGADAGAGLIETTAYMTPYFIPGAKGIVAGIVEASDRANELLNDSYYVDGEGNIRIKGLRDSAGTAIAKGAVRGAIAPLVERFGGELGGKVVGGIFKGTLGKIPLVKAAGNKVVETSAGKAIGKWMKSMSRLGKYTGMQSMPIEMLEEFEDQVLDTGLGLNLRESEKNGTNGFARAVGAAKDFFKPENLKDLANSMILIQVLGGGAAYMNDRRITKHLDNLIADEAGIDPKDLAGYSLEDKQAAYQAFIEGLSEAEVSRRFNRGAEAINKLANAIRDGRYWKDNLDSFEEEALASMDEPATMPDAESPKAYASEGDLLSAEEAQAQEQARAEWLPAEKSNEVVPGAVIELPDGTKLRRNIRGAVKWQLVGAANNAIALADSAAERLIAGGFRVVTDGSAKGKNKKGVTTNETGANETQPQSEQAPRVTPPEGEAARPVEEGETPAEVGGAIEAASNAPTSAPTKTTTTTPSTSAESTEGDSRISDEDSIKNRWKELKVSERPRPFDLRKSRANLAERLKNETDITTAKLEEELAQKKSTLETGRLSKRLGSRRELRAEVQALEEYLALPEEFGKLTMEAPKPPKLRTQAEADAAVVSETQSQMMGDELPVVEKEEILPSEDIANEPDEVANVDVLPTTDLPETKQEKLDNNLNKGVDSPSSEDKKSGRKRMSEVEKKEALIKRKTLKAKIIYDDLKSNNVKLTSSAFRYNKNNPRGLRLNELYEVAEFDDSAKEYLIEAGLTEEQADELIALVKNAEIAQKLAAPNRADKINEVGQETNAVKASQALTNFAHHPDDLKAIAKAFHAVSAAAETSSRTQDEADYWESKLQEIVALIITLPQESQDKVQYYVRQEDNNPDNTKNTTHITNSNGGNNESLAQVEANVNEINFEESQKIANEAFADKGDATQEAPGGGSMGEGGFTNRKGNRLFTIVKISEDGKTFTVKMQNVGKGDRGEQTVDVSQKALDALAKAEPMWAELAKNPVVGAQVLRSIKGETKAERDLRFSNDKDYQKWLKKQKANDAEPLRQRYEAEGLNAAASMVGNFLKGVKTKTVDRDYNPETDGGEGNRNALNVDHKKVDGDERFLRDPKTGKVVGTWNRNTNELTLYRGANANTLIHELGGHAAYQFAQQQAEQGDTALLRKMDEAIDYALNNPIFQDFIADVRSRYPDAGEDVLRDEIWAALMERNSPTMEAAIKTLQGKAWYNRAWQAIKDAFKAMLTHMGYNKADLRGIDKMKPEEFISWLDNTMAEGKSLGALEKEKGEGVRNAFINPMTLPNLYAEGSAKQFREFERIAKRVDKLEEMESMGIDRDTIWQETGLWRGKDGEIRTEVPDIKVSDGFLKYMQLNANVEPTRQLKTVDAESGDNEWLFRLYPEFRTMPITITNIGGGTLGIYRGVKDGILLDRSLLSDPEMFRAVLAHELQHAIQLEEGFSTGTNLENMGEYDDYKRATGEVEARNVAARLALTPKGREAVPPWETEDVSEDEQIVDYEGGVSLSQTRRNDTPTDNNIRHNVSSQGDASNHFMDDVRSTKEKLEEKFVDSLAPVKGVVKEIDQIAKARGEKGIEEVVNEDGSTDFINSTDYIAAKDKENGHLERKLRELQQKYIDPAMKSLARAILPRQNKDDLVTDFNLYLQYKHAEARNRKVAEDRGDTYTPDYSEGMGVIRIDGRPPVGLSENVANELLAELERKYGSKMKFFEDAAQSVYNMLEADLVNRNESGLLSDEELQHYMDRRNGSMGWGTYVPLKTDLQKTEGEAYNAFNSGIKRNEFMKAKGRGSLDIADSPFAAAILQAEQGIRRSSRNVLANVEANIAALMNGGFQRNGLTDFSVTKRLGDNENAEPVYAEIVEGEDLSRGGTEFQFVFSNGDRAIASGGSRLVQNRSDIHLFKRDGKLYAIRYVQGANNRGLAVAKSFSGENMGYWGKGMEWLPKFANFLSAMRTQYSPEFMVSNMLSDNLDAFQALVGRYGIWDGSKAFAKAVKNQWKNGKDLAHYLKTGEARGKVKDAINAGLLTKGGVVSEGIESETVKIRGDISKFIRKQKQWRDMTKGDLVKSFGRNVMDFISMANEFAEYSTRIGISSALEEYGIPRKDAIKFARDATVNFNRKGTAMPYINSLYIFANASVQGAMRSLGAFKDDLSNTKVRSGELGANRKFKGELVGTLVLIGVAKAVVDSLIGDDDEREKQGINNATNLTEYDRKHNVGIPIGGGRQVVPLRFRGPYAAIPYLAQTFTRVAMGEITPTRAAEIVASELGDQTTELIGGNGILNDKGEFDGSLFMQSIAPTLIDPFVQIGTGKDYKGDNRLRKRYDETVPLSSNAKRSTPMPYVKLAKIINLLTGGNENRSGRADFAPEDIQLITEFLGGAPWRDINNVISTGQNIAQVTEGGSPEKFLSQMPFVRRVVREYPENTGRYYDAIETYERDKAEYKRTMRLEDRRELKKGKPYLSSEKNYLDKLIDQVNDLSHLENGEVKRGRKWVKAKVERSEKQKEAYRKRRLRLQSRILKTLEG